MTAIERCADASRATLLAMLSVVTSPERLRTGRHDSIRQPQHTLRLEPIIPAIQIRRPCATAHASASCPAALTHGSLREAGVCARGSCRHAPAPQYHATAVLRPTRAMKRRVATSTAMASRAPAWRRQTQHAARRCDKVAQPVSVTSMSIQWLSDGPLGSLNVVVDRRQIVRTQQSCAARNQSRGVCRRARS